MQGEEEQKLALGINLGEKRRRGAPPKFMSPLFAGQAMEDSRIFATYSVQAIKKVHFPIVSILAASQKNKVVTLWTTAIMDSVWEGTLIAC